MPRTRSTPVQVQTIKKILEAEYPDEPLTWISNRIGWEESRLRHTFKRSFMSFENADEVLTRLHIWHYWHMDEELQEVYAYLDDLDRQELERQAVHWLKWYENQALIEQGVCAQGHSRDLYWKAYGNRELCSKCMSLYRAKYDDKRKRDKLARQERELSAA